MLPSPFALQSSGKPGIYPESWVLYFLKGPKRLAYVRDRDKKGEERKKKGGGEDSVRGCFIDSYIWKGLVRSSQRGVTTFTQTRFILSLSGGYMPYKS